MGLGHHPSHDLVASVLVFPIAKGNIFLAGWLEWYMGCLATRESQRRKLHTEPAACTILASVYTNLIVTRII